ncbi:MAG: hypothetical protein J0L84_00385 [Verrucomicrobia bacterium]|nr:hypothetical protein [Verrucomicrobiota bacterium]
MNIRTLSFLAIVAYLVAAAYARGAELYPSVANGVTVDPATGALKRPANFFLINRDLIVEAIGTNEFGIPPDTLIIRPVLTNATVGGTFTLQPGAAIIGRVITIEGDPNTLSSSNAITKGYVDQVTSVMFTALDQRTTLYVTNLAQLRAVSALSLDRYRPAEVLEDTGGDKAKGRWIWHPFLVAGETAQIVRPNSLGVLDAGRWIKMDPHNAVLSGNTVVPSGASLDVASGGTVNVASGATLSATKVTVTGTPTAGTDAVNKSYTDLQDLLGKLYTDQVKTRIVANLAALRALPISTEDYMLAEVLFSTSGDGSSGTWFWDPDSLGTTNFVCVTSTSGDPGRWFKR